MPQLVQLVDSRPPATATVSKLRVLLFWGDTRQNAVDMDFLTMTLKTFMTGILEILILQLDAK